MMSWWDYGYQITAMANRTILVDNNTWNNTHISRVGQAMSSPEDKAYEIMRELDVDYVLVIFGGLTGYASDGEHFTQQPSVHPCISMLILAHVDMPYTLHLECYVLLITCSHSCVMHW